MTYKVIFTNSRTGEAFVSCRRFPTREGATGWAADYAPQFAEPVTWTVEEVPSPVDAGRGLDE